MIQQLNEAKAKGFSQLIIIWKMTNLLWIYVQYLPKEQEDMTEKTFVFFVKKLVKKLRRNNHKNELEIAEYIALFEQCPQESKKKREKIIADLTLKGNNEYNVSIMTNSDSNEKDDALKNLLPVKRPPLGKSNENYQYVKCTICSGFFVQRHFYQHAAQCLKKNKDREYLADVNDTEIDNELNNEEVLVANTRSSYLKQYGIKMFHTNVTVSKKFQEEILS